MNIIKFKLMLFIGLLFFMLLTASLITLILGKYTASIILLLWTLLIQQERDAMILELYLGITGKDLINKKSNDYYQRGESGANSK